MTIKYEKQIVIIFLFLLCALTSVDAELNNVLINKISEGINISLNSTSDAALHLIKPSMPVPKPIGFDDSYFFIDSDEFKIEGIYEYYITNSEDRYPLNGTIKILMFNNTRLLSEAEKLMNNRSLDSTPCNPMQGGFTCGISSFQTANIAVLSKLYQETKNETYLENAYLLLTNKYAQVAFETSKYCDAYENDFNCSRISRIGIGAFTGASRQAKNIIWLTRAYKDTGNKSFLDYAIRYANGVAEECDIWVGDYDCETAEDQNLMIQAYNEIYIITKNNTYLQTILNLNQYALSNGYDTSGILSQQLSYQNTGNQTYITLSNLHANNTKIDCTESECTLYDRLKNIYYFGKYISIYPNYENRIILDKKYYLNHQSNCDIDSQNYQCENSEEQALYAYVLMTLPFEENESKVFDIAFNQTPEVLKSIEVEMKAKGQIENPLLYYKNIDSLFWRSTNFSKNYTVILNSTEFLEEKTYEFYINYSNGRYPLGNGTIKQVFNQKRDSTKEKIIDFLNEDSLQFCDILGTKPYYSDYSCRMENMQSKMITSQYNAYNLLQNQSILQDANKLANSIMDDTSSAFFPIGRYQTCDYNYDDYTCNDVNNNFKSNPLQREATFKQAQMIYSLSQAYKETDDSTTYKRLLGYAYSQTADCQVWENDYDCQDDDSQSQMILAYAEIYTATGIEDFFNIAIKLSENALSKTGSVNLINSYSRMYELTGNQTYLNKMNSLLIVYDDACESTACDVETYSNTIRSFFEAFKQTGEGTTQEAAYRKSTYDPINSNYCNPNGGDVSSATCYYPDQKGDMLNYLITYHNNFYPMEKNYSTSINAPIMTNFNKPFNVTCNVTNHAPFSNSNVEVILHSSSMDILLANTSVPFTRINNRLIISTFDSNETLMINYVINATRGGEHTFVCEIFGFQNTTDVTVTNLGDIIEMNYTEEVGRNLNSISSEEFFLINPNKFDLDNITIILNKSIDMNITSITSENFNMIVENNSKIIINKLLSNQTFDFQIEYFYVREGYFSLDLNISGNYNLSSNYTQYYQIYDNTFSINISKNVEEVQVYTFFNVTYVVSNNKNITFSDMRLDFNKDENENLVFVNRTIKTDNAYSLNSNKSFNISFQPYSTFNITYFYYFNDSNNSISKITLNSQNYYSINKIIYDEYLITDKHYEIIWDPQSPKYILGETNNLKATITNIADFNLSFLQFFVNYSDITLFSSKTYTSNQTEILNDSMNISLYNNSITLNWELTLTEQEQQQVTVFLKTLNNKTIYFPINISYEVLPTTTTSSSGGGSMGQVGEILEYDKEEIRDYINDMWSFFEDLTSDQIEEVINNTYDLLQNISIISKKNYDKRTLTIKSSQYLDDFYLFQPYNKTLYSINSTNLTENYENMIYSEFEINESSFKIDIYMNTTEHSFLKPLIIYKKCTPLPPEEEIVYSSSSDENNIKEDISSENANLSEITPNNVISGNIKTKESVFIKIGKDINNLFEKSTIIFNLVKSKSFDYFAILKSYMFSFWDYLILNHFFYKYLIMLGIALINGVIAYSSTSLINRKKLHKYLLYKKAKSDYKKNNLDQMKESIDLLGSNKKNVKMKILLKMYRIKHEIQQLQKEIIEIETSKNDEKVKTKLIKNIQAQIKAYEKELEGLEKQIYNKKENKLEVDTEIPSDKILFLEVRKYHYFKEKEKSEDLQEHFTVLKDLKKILSEATNLSMYQKRIHDQIEDILKAESISSD